VPPPFNFSGAGYSSFRAEVAELADAPDSKSGGAHAPCEQHGETHGSLMNPLLLAQEPI
jgi:hypothetical protein